MRFPWKQAVLTAWLLGVAASLPAWAQVDTAALASLEGRTVTAIGCTGLEHTKVFVVTRELKTAVGEPLRLAVLAADLARLDNLAIFASVKVTGQPDGKGAALAIALEETIRRVAFPALSYNEQNGWSVGIGGTLLNLFGRNMLFSGRFLFGGVDTYALKFADPWVGGNHVGYQLAFTHIQRFDKLNGFREDSHEFAPRLTAHLGRNGRVGASVGYFRMRSDVPGKTLSATNEDRFALFGVHAGYDSRDSWQAPRRGWQNQVDVWRVEGSGSYWRTNVDVRRFQPAGRPTLELSGLLSLQSGQPGVDVPQYLEYRLGGANSVRGHDVQTLGQEIYGKNQLLATAEYVVPLRDRAYINPFGRLPIKLGVDATFFADLGTAWSEPKTFATDRFRGGIGAGIRVLIPAVDQLRLEVGWSPSGGAMLHFAAGFKLDEQRERLR